MKMKLVKKIVAATTVATLVLASSMSVFAAGSPTAVETPIEITDNVPEEKLQPVETVAPSEVVVDTDKVAEVTTNSGETFTDVVVKVGTEDVKETPSVAEVEKALEYGGLTGTDATVTSDTKVILTEVHLETEDGQPIDGADLAKGVNITFKLDGVEAGDTVVVMNYRNGGWVYIPATVNADGSVTATFSHLSPVAFVIKKAEKTPTPTPGTVEETKPTGESDKKVTTTSTTKTSPKTGE